MMPPDLPCLFGGEIGGTVCGISACDAPLFRVVLYRLVDCRFFAIATSSLDECCRFLFRDLRPGEYTVALVDCRCPALADSQSACLTQRCMQRLDIVLNPRCR